MTFEQIKTDGRNFLNADDIAEVLESDAQSIRQQAQADPTKLGFPVIVIGKRVKFPRVGFVAFAEQNIFGGQYADH